MERSEIQFGTTHIPFLIRRSDRRATVALAIDGGRLVVTAPAGATVARLNDLVRGKALWVKQHLQRAGRDAAPPAREFVSGETFRYLGRQHRLRVVPGPSQGDVKLDRGWLVVPVPALHDERPRHVRAALVAWYRRHAEARLPERVEAWAKRFGIPAPAVLVRDQQRRWGSCNQAGEVRLNWRIVQAPFALIDYVVAHELAHVVRDDDIHSPAFWALLGRLMPDYDARRERLRATGTTLIW